MARQKANRGLKTETMNALRGILRKEGLAGMNVRTISKEVGFSVGTFYNYFQNLEDLILHMNGETILILENIILETISPEDNLKTVIKKISTNYFKFAEKFQVEWLLFFQHNITGEIPEWYQNRVDELFQKIYNALSPFLGGTNKEIERCVKTLWSGLHGICSLTISNKLRFSVQYDPVEMCQDFLYNYIMGHKINNILSTDST
jgi:AcrR family transcriptional regulator